MDTKAELRARYRLEGGSDVENQKEALQSTDPDLYARAVALEGLSARYRLGLDFATCTTLAQGQRMEEAAKVGGAP